MIKRVIWHWTAGAGRPSVRDLEHYHFCIDQDGHVSLGLRSVDDNIDCKDGIYARHTKGLNTGSIGIACCGMHGATESDPWKTKYPLTHKQIDEMLKLTAALCRKYRIPITPETVLSHGEVQETLKVKQNGKWDIMVLPFETQGLPVNDWMRKIMKEIYKEQGGD